MTNTITGVTVGHVAVFKDVNGNIGDGGAAPGVAQGTVTAVSVATANGFAGTVANPTTTPAITIKTGVTGILKGDGTAASAAVAGTDYLSPTVPSNITANSAASTPSLELTGSLFTGGSGSTTLPQFLVAPGGAVGVWSTTGTLIGTVAPSAFPNNAYHIDLKVVGANSVFNVSGLGDVYCARTITGSNLSGTNTGDSTAPAQVLTGYVSGSGTVSPSDSILTAIQKLNGNTALLTGAIVYQGTWNANTNTPTLASGVGIKGTLYKVSVAGTTSIDGINQWNVGDSIVFDGTVWDKIDGLPNEVISVAGRTGVVTLAVADVSGAVPNTTTVNGHALSSNVVVSASDITTGTLPVAQLPAATSSTLGAVEPDNSTITISAGVITAVATAQGLVGQTVNLIGKAPGSAKTATYTADEIIVESALGGTPVKLSSVSLSFNGATTGANGMDTGATPTSGNLYLYAIYNGTTVAILGTTQGSGSSVYSGANMPGGYTKSALIGAVVTDGSGNLPFMYQTGHVVKVAANVVINSGAGQNSATSQSLSAAVPAIAKTVSGYLSQSQATSTNQQLKVAADTGLSLGLIQTGFLGTTVTGNNLSLPFENVPMNTAQTLYYATGNTTAASVFLIINGYTF